jgi:hypothetical protein
MKPFQIKSKEAAKPTVILSADAANNDLNAKYSRLML